MEVYCFYMVSFVGDKKLVDTIIIREKLSSVKTDFLEYDFSIKKGEKNINFKGVMPHPNVGCLILPLGVGIPRDWVDLSPYATNWSREYNLGSEAGKVSCKLDVFPDIKNGNRITKCVLIEGGSNIYEDFWVDWSSDDVLRQSLQIRSDEGNFLAMQVLYKNDDNLGNELKEIYDKIVKEKGESPEIYHKKFSGSGFLPDLFLKSDVLGDFNSYEGEMIELGFDVEEGRLRDFTKVGFFKVNREGVFDTYYFEIDEDDILFEDIVFEGESYNIRSRYEKIIKIYK